MTTCAACGSPLEPGAALLVTESATGHGRTICRPGIRPSCFGRVGPARVETIALADTAAARRYDAATVPADAETDAARALRHALEASDRGATRQRQLVYEP